MSIKSEISRIATARNKIRAKLVAFGLVQSTANIDECTIAIEGIANNGAVSAEVAGGEVYKIPAGYHNGMGTVSGTSGGGAFGQFTKIETLEWTPNADTKTYQLPYDNIRYCMISDQSVQDRPNYSIISLLVTDSEFFAGFKPSVVFESDFSGNLTQSVNYYGFRVGTNSLEVSSYFRAGRTYDVIIVI